MRTSKKGAAVGKSRPLPLLVGELNLLSNDPNHALFPYPTNGSGGRLAMILGLTPTQYMNMFDRVNLCTGRWSLAKARIRVCEVVAGREVIVLLGSKVTAACGYRYEPFRVYYAPSAKIVVLPHPSGLCRVWNDPLAEHRARVALVNAGVKIKWRVKP